MSMNELNTTARDLMSVRAMIEELQAEAEALTDKLKAAMVEQGTEALQGDGWKATWKNVNSSRFDSKSFKADHGKNTGGPFGDMSRKNARKGAGGNNAPGLLLFVPGTVRPKIFNLIPYGQNGLNGQNTTSGPNCVHSVHCVQGGCGKFPAGVGSVSPGTRFQFGAGGESLPRWEQSALAKLLTRPKKQRHRAGHAAASLSYAL